MDSSAKKKQGRSGRKAASTLKTLANLPDLKCDACLELLKNPVTLPCEHFFCDKCFKTAEKMGNDGFKCLKCQKVAMPLLRSQLLVKLCELLQKYQDHAKRKAPPDGAEMLERGLRAPKTPVRYDSPEPVPVKRRKRGHTLLDDISVTSAKALQDFMPRPAGRSSIRFEVPAELPPQTPNTKDAERTVRHPEQPSKRNNNHAAGQKESDSGVLTGDSFGLPTTDQPLMKGKRLQDKAQSFGMQNVSTGSAERSPGWSRMKKACKELHKNEKTLKALDVSGGELSKRSGLASRKRALPTTSNETKKAMPLQKAKSFNKNTTQAETFERTRNMEVDELEPDFLDLTNDIEGARTKSPADENADVSGCHKNKADVGRSALDKSKGKAEKLTQLQKENDSFTKIHTTAAKGIGKKLEEKSPSVTEKIVPIETDAQEKAKKEKDRADIVLKDVTGKDMGSSAPLNSTLNDSNEEIVKVLPVRKAVRRLNKQKSRAEIFQFGVEADHVGVHEEVPNSGTKTPADEISQNRHEEKAETVRHARDKLKGVAKKVGPQPTQTGADKSVAKKKRNIVLKTTQEKSMIAVEKVLPKNTKETAQPDPSAEKVNLVDNFKPDYEKSGFKTNKGEDLKTTQELANAYVERVSILQALENSETAPQDNIPTRAKRGRRKKVDAVPKNTAQKQGNAAKRDDKKKEIDAEADNQRMQDIEQIIANHDSEKSVENVTKTITGLEYDADFTLSEDESGERELLLKMKNRVPSKIISSGHNFLHSVAEKSPEFFGFGSRNKADKVPETLKKSSLEKSSDSDVLRQTNVEDLPLDITRTSVPKKFPASGSSSKGSALTKLPDTTIRKTFSLEADTQDLAYITANEEDSFDTRIHEIAKANRNTKTPSKLVGKVTVASTPINLQSTHNSSKEMSEISSQNSTAHSSKDDIIEQFKRFLDNNIAPNDSSECNISQTEFRNMRVFFIADKGPFVSSTGESLRGKRVFVELDPSSISKEVRVRQNPVPGNDSRTCGCKCPCVADKSLPAANDGGRDSSGDETAQSMAVNYIPSVQAKCDQIVTGSGNVGNNKMPADKMTLPVNSQETEQSKLLSFREKDQRSKFRCTLGATQVSASLRAVIEPDEQGPSQIEHAPQNVQMEKQGDSVQQRTKEKILGGVTPNLPNPKATFKAASAYLGEPEPDVSDNEFIPDTIPDHQYVSKTLRPAPPAVIVKPATVKLRHILPKVTVNQGNILKKVSQDLGPSTSLNNHRLPFTYVPGGTSVNKVQAPRTLSKSKQANIENSDEAMPNSQPPKILPLASQQSTGVIPKNKQVNNRTLNASYVKPCPKSFKPYFKKMSSQATVPRLTDPTDLGNDKSETGGKKKFRRIQAPSDSSESEYEVLGTVVITSDDSATNRMSDDDSDSNTLQLILNEQCRGIPSSQREAFEMDLSIQALESQRDLPLDKVTGTPEIPDSFTDAQQIVSGGAPTAAENDLDLGDKDNDVTHFEGSSEQVVHGADTSDEEDDDMVTPTPERKPRTLKSIQRHPVLPPPQPAMPLIPKESARLGLAPGFGLDDRVNAFPEAVHILSSGLSSEKSKLLSQMIVLVGAKQDPNATKQTTHLVSATDKNGSAPRTAKLMMAIALGTWVVSMSWVHACISARCLVNAEPYELEEMAYGESPRRSRLDRKRLLRDFAFFLVPPFSGPVERNSFELILTYAGAAIASNATDKAGKEHLIALTEMVDSPEHKTFVERYMAKEGILILAYSWIHTAICSHKLRTVWNHLPVDATVPPHVQRNYPSQMFSPRSTSDEESNGSDDET